MTEKEEESFCIFLHFLLLLKAKAVHILAGAPSLPAVPVPMRGGPYGVTAPLLPVGGACWCVATCPRVCRATRGRAGSRRQGGVAVPRRHRASGRCNGQRRTAATTIVVSDRHHRPASCVVREVRPRGGVAGGGAVSPGSVEVPCCRAQAAAMTVVGTAPPVVCAQKL